MPIWLRRFTYALLKKHYEKESEEVVPPPSSKNKIHRPGIQPSYSTKASK